MVARLRGALDNNFKQISTITQTDPNAMGFLNTNTGALDLPAWQTPDVLNIIPFPDKLIYRGGSSLYSTLPAGADGAFPFYDINGLKHFAVWSNGNLYDVVGGSPITINSGVYIPGQRIGHAVFNGTLYWSTITTPLRFWKPSNATTGTVTGAYPVPATDFLFEYNGALVALAPFFGPTRQPSTFVWSNTNDPTTWVPANAQEVGGLDGGVLVFGQNMGISNVGVSPIHAMVIGKSTENMWLYQGALGALTEQLISCPVGMLDGDSAQYIPAPQGFGYIIWLGSDSQFWWTNGTQAEVISTDILPSLYNTVQDARLANPSQRFRAAYNESLQYYVCDMGSNFQYAFRWQTKAWTQFHGIPSGWPLVAPNNAGFPTIFIAADAATFGLYQTGIVQAGDSGTTPDIHYTTPFLHGGAVELLKEFQWVDIVISNQHTTYGVTGVGLPRADNSALTSSTLLFSGTTPITTDQAEWNVSSWDQADWVGTPSPLVQNIVPLHGRLSCPVPQNLYGRAGVTEPLRSGAAQFTIAYNSNIIDFQLLAFQTRFIPRGFRGVGNAQYSTDNGVRLAGPDPFSAPSSSPPAL
jgi:hypothetical protein